MSRRRESDGWVVAQRPEFVDFAVNGATDGTTLGALRWTGIGGAPALVAVHGITSNAWAWDPLAHHLAGAANIVAVDLRGRGRSYEAPGPYGIARHAADIATIVATIVEELGAPLFLIGHSMGAFVVEMVAEQHPDLVRDIVLVDGGTPLEPPADGNVDAALDRMLGPGIDRIRTIWPDRVSYQSMWASHPAFVNGIGPDLERNLLADLIEADDGFRTAVSEAAVVQDGRDLLTSAAVRTLLDRRQRPTTIIRAEFGILGERPGFITPDVPARYPQHHWVEAVGLNHYTLMNSSDGAELVAQALRRVLLD